MGTLRYLNGNIKIFKWELKDIEKKVCDEYKMYRHNHLHQTYYGDMAICS